jgi:hypothetical protein
MLSMHFQVLKTFLSQLPRHSRRDETSQSLLREFSGVFRSSTVNIHPYDLYLVKNSLLMQSFPSSWSVSSSPPTTKTSSATLEQQPSHPSSLPPPEPASKSSPQSSTQSSSPAPGPPVTQVTSPSSPVPFPLLIIRSPPRLIPYPVRNGPRRPRS